MKGILLALTLILGSQVAYAEKVVAIKEISRSKTQIFPSSASNLKIASFTGEEFVLSADIFTAACSVVTFEQKGLSQAELAESISLLKSTQQIEGDWTRKEVFVVNVNGSTKTCRLEVRDKIVAELGRLPQLVGVNIFVKAKFENEACDTELEKFQR